MLAHCITMKSFLGIILLAASSPAARADEVIEVREPSVHVSSDEIFHSEFYEENRDEILEVAHSELAEAAGVSPEMRASIAGSLDELPFHRIVDIELAFLSGFPDTIALCLEGHPVKGLAIEGCASATLFLASVSANVKYRWDLVLHRNERGRIHELSAGPGIGIRGFRTDGFVSWHELGWAPEVMGSLEYVYWTSRHFGFTAQLDAGASYFIYSGNSENRVVPLARLTAGVAF